MKMRASKLFFILACFTLHLNAGAAVLPVVLRCDSGTDPLGVDSPSPHLSWQMQSDEPGQLQTAYRIIASSSAGMLEQDRGDLWDTGKINSADCINLSWKGKLLASSQQIFWKVQLWDRKGKPTAWSKTATFTMGLLTEKDWCGAQWITDPDLLKWVRPAIGYRSEEAPRAETTKWIQIDLGADQSIDSVHLLALEQGVSERLGFPYYFKIEASSSADMAGAVTLADHTVTPPNIWFRRLDFPVKNVSARYLRLTATKLRDIGGVHCLGLSQIVVYSGDRNIAAGAKVTASDSIEKPPFAAAAVTDGLGLPGVNPRSSDTLLLRRDFLVRPRLRRAIVHVSGQGSCQVTVNGRPVTEGLLTPGWTDTEKTCLYETYDITNLLQPTKRNTIGLSLAGGMYNVQVAPKRYNKFATSFHALTAKGLVRLEYDGGFVETIPTDNTWRLAPGPTVLASMYSGEDFDARRAIDGWNQPGFDDGKWSSAVVNPHAPAGALRGFSHASPPFKLFETLNPISTKELKPGVTVYDLGQNASLMLDLKVRGPAGASVKILPAELLKADGSVERGSSGGGDASWNYTLAGKADGEEWHPRFFYHGARYLEVRCVAPLSSPEALPVIEAISARVAHSDALPAGEFSCSNELFNRIRELVRWAQRSNFAHVLTDCPHRERLGWLEQYHLNGPSLRYEFELDRLYSKNFDDMLEAQTPVGLIPSIVPEFVIFDGGFRDSPEWGSALVLAAWQHFQWTGDDTVLRHCYPAMVRYLAYLDTKVQPNGLLNHGLGDWYDQGPNRPGLPQLTPIALPATAFYYHTTETLAKIAQQLGQADEAAAYEQKAAKIADDFNRAFFNLATATYATGSQTAQSLPLVLNLVPPAKRPAVVAVLLRDIESRDYAVTAGDIGYRYLLRALADAGRSDVIFRINSQKEKPGYGYQLEHGCTSLAEAWNAERHASQNHFMLGHIIEWFYADVAGLAPDPAAPGFKNILIQPRPTGDLTWANARHQTPYGSATVQWKIADGRFELHVEIPPNATATIRVPGRNAQLVDPTGASTKSPWVQEISRTGNECFFTVASGQYRFLSDW
ncbi:MAG: family 78 glycoside hydrolase catalytic domain [Nibricoccus sp.]